MNIQWVCCDFENISLFFESILLINQYTRATLLNEYLGNNERHQGICGEGVDKNQYRTENLVTLHVLF